MLLAIFLEDGIPLKCSKNVFLNSKITNFDDDSVICLSILKLGTLFSQRTLWCNIICIMTREQLLFHLSNTLEVYREMSLICFLFALRIWNPPLFEMRTNVNSYRKLSELRRTKVSAIKSSIKWEQECRLAYRLWKEPV